MLRALTLSAVALLLAACGGDTTTDSATATDSATVDISDSSWHADVSPVLQTHCTRCHYDGGVGTGDFTDYATASAMAEIMLDQIDAGLMPPPASDPDCRDYEASEALHLSDDVRAILGAWVDGGTPEGDVADSVAVDAVVETLPNPDVEVLMSDA